MKLITAAFIGYVNTVEVVGQLQENLLLQEPLRTWNTGPRTPTSQYDVVNIVSYKQNGRLFKLSNSTYHIYFFGLYTVSRVLLYQLFFYQLIREKHVTTPWQCLALSRVDVSFKVSMVTILSSRETDSWNANWLTQIILTAVESNFTAK